MNSTIRGKKKRIEFVVEKVSKQFEYEGYADCRPTTPLGKPFFEFNRLLDEHYASVVSLFFEDGFGLIYAVEPIIWLESGVDPLQLSNFDCSFRHSLWNVARYFQPSLFAKSDIRGLTLHWELYDSAQQLSEAVSDLLSCHKQLYSQYFDQFRFPKPLTEISVEDIQNGRYDNKLNKLGLKMNVDVARKLAAFLRSTNDLGVAVDLDEWADEVEARFR